MIVIKDVDLRKFPRRGFRANVELVDHVRDKRFSALSVDLNPLGMYIETRRPFSEGEIITLKFPSPSGPYDLCVTGQVVRVHDANPERGAGVAIEFFGVEEWVFDELSSYVYGPGGERTLVVTVGPPPG